MWDIENFDTFYSICCFSAMLYKRSVIRIRCHIISSAYCYIYHFLCQHDVSGSVDDDWFEYDNEGNRWLVWRRKLGNGIRPGLRVLERLSRHVERSTQTRRYTLCCTRMAEILPGCNPPWSCLRAWTFESSNRGLGFGVLDCARWSVLENHVTNVAAAVKYYIMCISCWLD